MAPALDSRYWTSLLYYAIRDDWRLWTQRTVLVTLPPCSRPPHCCSNTDPTLLL